MITPRFSLSQDANTVSILIRAPYCSLRELDVNVEEHSFIFFCQPYYLRLHLPGQIEENDHTKSSFDADTGHFTFQYEKVTPGEQFPDLEFVTKLLCSKVEAGEGERKIEILGAASEALDVKPDDTARYGFAMRGGYNFSVLSGEFRDIFEIDPHEVKLEDRPRLRLQNEREHFDPEHYEADLLDNDEIKELLRLPAPWDGLGKAQVEFTPKELDFLKDLPNVSYNLSEEQVKFCRYGLLELLYAYCYDRRTTCFESTCESGWTISKLSATLSWFDGFLQPKQAFVCAFRRSLIYPLYREFNLSQQIFRDVKNVVKLGEQFIIKCLIEMYDIFVTGDTGRYILNNLFIKDYIVYVMKWDKGLWAKTVQEVDALVVEKNDLGLNLLQIEQSMGSENDLSAKMGRLRIDGQECDSTDSDDLTSSSSDGESSGDSDSTDDSESEE